VRTGGKGAAAAPAAGVAPDEVMLPEAGLVVGAAAGRVVIGVGSGGNGFDMTLAIISVRPASELWRNLYQVVRLSIQTAF